MSFTYISWMRIFDYLFAFLVSRQRVYVSPLAMSANNMQMRTGANCQCLTLRLAATSLRILMCDEIPCSMSLGARPPSPLTPSCLVHLLDQSVDVLLSVTQVTTLDIMLELPRSETASGVAQLEWPKEVTCLFEVRSDGGNFVDQVFHTDDAELAQSVLDQLIICEGDALLVDLAIAALVDELTDGLEVRVPVGDVWVNDGEHLLRGFGQADEDAVVYLEKTEELENLARFRGDLGDTVG